MSVALADASLSAWCLAVVGRAHLVMGAWLLAVARRDPAGRTFAVVVLGAVVPKTLRLVRALGLRASPSFGTTRPS